MVRQWQPETTHGNCGKRKKWKRNLNLTTDALNGLTLRLLADKYEITPCMVSTLFRNSIRELKRYHGDHIEGLPTTQYKHDWDLRAMRHYKNILIPLLQKLDERRRMTRQTKRIQKAIDELIKIADDGYGTGALSHALDSLRSLETFYSSATARDFSSGRAPNGD